MEDSEPPRSLRAGGPLRLIDAAIEELQRGCTCFEMRPLGAPQHEVML